MTPAELRAGEDALTTAIREERRIRYLTIQQLEDEFGDDWPALSSDVRSKADRAVDDLAVRLADTWEALEEISDWLPDPMHPAFPQGLVDAQVGALVRISDALEALASLAGLSAQPEAAADERGRE